MSDALVRETSPVGSIDNTVQARAEEFQQIVDEAVSESFTGPIFLERLKAAGATPDEAQDYIAQLNQRRREHGTATASGSGGAQPGLADANMPSPVDVATSIAWALLWAKVEHLQSPSSGAARVADGTLSDELSTLYPLVKGLFRPPCSQKHPIWPSCQLLSCLTLTWKRLRSFFQSLLPRTFKTSLSTKHSSPRSGIRSLKPSGARFSLILTSIKTLCVDGQGLRPPQ